MANKRNKKRLSSKQANRISLLLGAIYFIFAFIIGIFGKQQNAEDAFVYWTLECIIGPMLIYSVFYVAIFQGERIEQEERIKEKEIENEIYLSCTEYKQVYLIEKNDKDDIVNMMSQILQKEECKFYAKLIENNNINLSVKDKHDEEVYSVNISNPFYFSSNFRFEEE